MNRKQDVYLRSPLWMQQVAGALYGAAWKRRRFGADFHRVVAELRDRDDWSADHLAAYQCRRVADLLGAAEASPYYRELLPPSWRDDPLRALAVMPILTKQVLRERGTDLLTGSAPRRTMRFRSSGTTGTPVEVFYPPKFHQLVQAYFEVRVREPAGVTYRDRRVMFGGRKVCPPGQTSPPFWRYSPVEKLAYCSIYHLSEGTLPAYLAFLRRFQPAVVMGYPHALAEVARFARAQGFALPAAHAVITSSETLTPSLRDALQGAWGVRVTDSYGAVEACVLAAQCPTGAMHVSTDFGLIEIIDDEGKACAPGVLGRIVATGLHNTLQPLVRYEIGDSAVWSTKSACSCGSALPMLDAVEGRTVDMCFTPDGRAILGFDNVFKGIIGLREAQVVQTEPDRFELRVVVDPTFGPSQEDALLRNMRAHVGDLRIVVVPVAQIPRSASGKFKPVVSLVSRPLHGTGSI